MFFNGDFLAGAGGGGGGGKGGVTALLASPLAMAMLDKTVQGPSLAGVDIVGLLSSRGGHTRGGRTESASGH